MKNLALVVLLTSCFFASHAVAQQTKNSLIVITGNGEVTAKNDQAKVTFFVEERDKDKGLAASRVNKKMNEGIEILKKSDPEAKLETHRYSTEAVYAKQTPTDKTQKIIGWEVRQYVELTTNNLEKLPKTVASVQNILALENLNFGLSDPLKQKLDAERLENAYKNMQGRLLVIAKAMGRKIEDATIEMLNFDGNKDDFEVDQFKVAYAPAAAASRDEQKTQEPNFEAGESTLSATIVAKLRFN